MEVSDEANNVIPMKFLRKIKNFFPFLQTQSGDILYMFHYLFFFCSLCSFLDIALGVLPLSVVLISSNHQAITTDSIVHHLHIVVTCLDTFSSSVCPLKLITLSRFYGKEFICIFILMSNFVYLTLFK
jgi:hypothetical protein